MVDRLDFNEVVRKLKQFADSYVYPDLEKHCIPYQADRVVRNCADIASHREEKSLYDDFSQ